MRGRSLPLVVWFLQLLATLKLTRIAIAAEVPGVALTPPRGWNSYDSYSWIISEEEFLQNAKLVSEKLLPFGYEYVVVDFLWYRKHAPGASVLSPGFDVVDAWGRPLPDPERWPSTRDGRGFAPIAEKVHNMGLKFGIHVMRGISTAAVAANCEILGAKGSPEGPGGRPWTAQDIALDGTECGWMKGCFMAVNTSTEGGSAFIKSLYQQYASWGVDFIKHDCVFGEDFRPDEIFAVSQAIVETGRPIVYSLSPGTNATPKLALRIQNVTNLYRVTSDDWDRWLHVQNHFDVARDFAAAGLIGAPGLHGGKSWPDLDMLPLGWLTDPGVDNGPHRPCDLGREEQKTQVTLWAMAKSPFMFGGDMVNLDQWTLDLLTNPVVLDIDAYSSDNLELFRSTAGKLVLQLVDCEHVYETTWSRRVLLSGDQVCWSTLASAQDEELRGCLDWRPSSEQPQLRTHPLTEAGQMCASYHENLCADAELITQAGSSVEYTGGPLTECRGKPSQTWLLAGEQLLSLATGMCAVVVEQGGNSRVWVAVGPSGEVIVAFFNIGSNTTTVTVSLDSVLRHMNERGHLLSVAQPVGPGTPESDWECQVKDGWDDSSAELARGYLSASVPSHGTVLSILSSCLQAPSHGPPPFVRGDVIILIAIVALAGLSLLRAIWLFQRRRPSGESGVHERLIAAEGGSA